jgi:hypothetical protein
MVALDFRSFTLQVLVRINVLAEFLDDLFVLGFDRPVFNNRRIDGVEPFGDIGNFVRVFARL